MHSTIMLPLISLGLAIVHAASTAASAGFSTECTDIGLQDTWLIGTCPNSTGAPIKSAVYLGYLITNNEAVLQWKANGAFERSCSSCSLLPSSGVLSCSCNPTQNNQPRVASINLEDHIANYDGHLLNDLSGSPTPPPDSSVPVPTDFGFQLSLSTSNVCNGGIQWSGVSPQNCFTLTVTSAGPVQFQAASLSSNQGSWNISYYDNAACAGAPLGNFLPGDSSDCRSFAPSVIGFRVTPLFNGDF